MLEYLHMLFYLILHVLQISGFNCRSQVSAQKAPIKITRFRTPKNSRKFRNTFLSEMSEGSKRWTRGGC